MQKHDKPTLGYKIGYLFGIIALTCMMSIVVALTVKFIFWLY